MTTVNAPAPANPELVVSDPDDSIGALGGRLNQDLVMEADQNRLDAGANPYAHAQIRKINEQLTIFSVPFARGGFFPIGGRSVSLLAFVHSEVTLDNMIKRLGRRASWLRGEQNETIVPHCVSVTNLA